MARGATAAISSIVMTPRDPASRTDISDWYDAMGIDEIIGDAPADWFAASIVEEQPQQRVPAPAPRERPAARPRQPVDDAAADATAAAAGADTLDALHAALAAFDGCGLKSTAKNLCFYRGSAEARIMFIGEAPGRDEDLQGRPFVGRAGRLLDKMLQAVSLGEDEVHITNVVYWRPPGNRTPSVQEVQACTPFLQRQIALVDPEILVFLGGAAAKQMLSTTEGIMRLRGKWRDLHAGEKERRALATLHPAYLLRNPVGKRLAWRDFLALRDALDA